MPRTHSARRRVLAVGVGAATIAGLTAPAALAATNSAPELTTLTLLTTGDRALHTDVRLSYAVAGDSTAYDASFDFVSRDDSFELTDDGTDTTREAVRTIRGGDRPGLYRLQSVFLASPQGDFRLYFDDGTVFACDETACDEASHTLAQQFSAARFTILDDPTADRTPPVVTAVRRPSSATVTTSTAPVELAVDVTDAASDVATVGAYWSNPSGQVSVAQEDAPVGGSFDGTLATRLGGAVSATDANPSPGRHQLDFVYVTDSEGNEAYYGRDGTGWSDAVDFEHTVALPAGDVTVPGGELVTLPAPRRLVDTRRTGTPLAAGAARSFAVDTGATGVDLPDGQYAGVLLNVTVTAPTASGYLTVRPTGAATTSSTLNFAAGGTVAAHVQTAVASDRRSIEVVNGSRGRSHVIVDVVGYLTAPAATVTGDTLVPLTPKRLLDTRTGTGVGRAGALGRSTLTFPARGGATTVPSHATAVVLNLTGVAATGGAYLTAHPTGSTSSASTLNVARGETRANLAVARIGADGRVAVTNGGGSLHVLADVVGYYVPAAAGTTTGRVGFGGTTDAADEAMAGWETTLPRRVVDTRDEVGSTDGLRVAPGAPLELSVEDDLWLESGKVGAVLLNVTAVSPTAGGYLTVHGSGPVPNASTLNYARGATVANAVVAKVGSDGVIRLSATAATHLVVDLAGVYAR